MASDQQVSPRAVLRALARVRREGATRVLEHLEQVEPDLASFLMEELSLVHRDLLAAAVPVRRVRRVQKRVEALALVCVTALRTAHFELWRDQAAGTPLAELDDPPDGDPPTDDGPARGASPPGQPEPAD